MLDIELSDLQKTKTENNKCAWVYVWLATVVAKKIKAMFNIYLELKFGPDQVHPLKHIHIWLLDLDRQVPSNISQYSNSIKSYVIQGCQIFLKRSTYILWVKGDIVFSGHKGCQWQQIQRNYEQVVSSLCFPIQPFANPEPRAYEQGWHITDRSVYTCNHTVWGHLVKSVWASKQQPFSRIKTDFDISFLVAISGIHQNVT